MNKERLLKLADFVGLLCEEEFDLDVIRDEQDCGTTACAIGWCPDVFLNQVSCNNGVFRGEDINFPAGPGMRGAMEFFGLTEQEFHFLFTPDGYINLTNGRGPNQKDFADRVHRFVNNSLILEDHFDKRVIEQAYLPDWEW